jgi:SNF2 family DNA or RNA helicase
LNLTEARKVIIVDQWWNAAADQQAFCRVYRHGQTQETELVVLAMKDTIDMRILHLQRQKEARIAKINMDRGLKRCGRMH